MTNEYSVYVSVISIYGVKLRFNLCNPVAKFVREGFCNRCKWYGNTGIVLDPARAADQEEVLQAGQIPFTITAMLFME